MNFTFSTFPNSRRVYVCECLHTYVHGFRGRTGNKGSAVVCTTTNAASTTALGNVLCWLNFTSLANRIRCIYIKGKKIIEIECSLFKLNSKIYKTQIMYDLTIGYIKNRNISFKHICLSLVLDMHPIKLLKWGVVWFY